MMMKKLSLGVAALLLLFTLSGCGNDDAPVVSDDLYDNAGSVDTTNETVIPVKEAPTYTSMFDASLAQFRLPGAGDTVVTLSTNYGDIHLLMFPEAAPKAVENFITHSQDDYYDGVTFHRVMNDFMIQGGDPTGTGRGGESIWGDNFEDEFSDDYFPFRGTLAMANAGPSTNGSQFFIVHTSGSNESIAEQMIDYGFDTEMVDAYKALGGTPHLFNVHTVFGQVVAGMDVVDAIANVKVGAADKPVKDVVIEDVTVTIIE